METSLLEFVIALTNQCYLDLLLLQVHQQDISVLKTAYCHLVERIFPKQLQYRPDDFEHFQPVQDLHRRSSKGLAPFRRF